jgi:hypothetical protein
MDGWARMRIALVGKIYSVFIDIPIHFTDERHDVAVRISETPSAERQADVPRRKKG